MPKGNTPAAARKGVETLLKNRGRDFFKQRAAKGGSAGRLTSEQAREYGRKGAAARWPKKAEK